MCRYWSLDLYRIATWDRVSLSRTFIFGRLTRNRGFCVVRSLGSATISNQWNRLTAGRERLSFGAKGIQLPDPLWCWVWRLDDWIVSLKTHSKSQLGNFSNLVIVLQRWLFCRPTLKGHDRRYSPSLSMLRFRLRYSQVWGYSHAINWIYLSKVS